MGIYAPMEDASKGDAPAGIGGSAGGAAFKLQAAIWSGMAAIRRVHPQLGIDLSKGQAAGYDVATNWNRIANCEHPNEIDPSRVW
jgi:hypothetical protein